MAASRSDTIEADDAQSLFAEFAEANYLALRYPVDGCYARTHVMVRQMLHRGYAPVKKWAFSAGFIECVQDRLASQGQPELLWVDGPEGRIRWGYHVAPALMVRGVTNEAPRYMVFDPILFDRPVTVDDWLQALHDTPTVISTPVGEPPFPTLGGSGYFPGEDHSEGPDEHARETLEEYERRT